MRFGFASRATVPWIMLECIVERQILSTDTFTNMMTYAVLLSNVIKGLYSTSIEDSQDNVRQQMRSDVEANFLSVSQAHPKPGHVRLRTKVNPFLRRLLNCRQFLSSLNVKKCQISFTYQFTANHFLVVPRVRKPKSVEL